MVIDQVSVNQSLSELLDDNFKAIQQFITNESIEQVVNSFHETIPHQKYLGILSAMCICQGRAVTKNQNCVLELFFKRTS
jgi:hypothetical protein